MRAHLLQRRKINLSQVFAGQTVGIKKVDDHLDEPIANPFGWKSAYVSGTNRHPYAQNGPLKAWCPGAESNHRHADFQSAALPTELPGLTVRMCALGRWREASGLI